MRSQRSSDVLEPQHPGEERTGLDRPFQAAQAKFFDVMAHGLEEGPRRAGNGVVGRQRIVPSGSRYFMRPRTSWRIRLAQTLSPSGIIDPVTSALATEKAKRGLRSSSQLLNVA